MPDEAIQPGDTAFTRTPAKAHSCASVIVRLTMPARAAPVCAMVGKPFLMSAAMFTIEPPWLSIDCLKTSRLTMKPPVRLLRTTTSKPLALMSAAIAGNWPPALLNRPWMRPLLATIVGDRLLDLRFLADVEGVRLARAAGRLDLRLHRGELLGLAAGDDDVRAQRRDLVRGAAADAAAASRDDHGLAGEQIPA